MNKKCEIKNRIIALKMNLAKTDYQAIKYGEGAITEEEYAPIKAQRQAWRDEINNLENQLKELAYESN
jgi:phage-related minor tail protein